ncbi:MAG: ribbon-helix-helix domain-containing protein [Magnetovibrio sp.]|nr:ribbon-helix-helix domain-containing protein [Magnetovibrio sp.]
MKSQLISRNITVNGRRTSMRLEEAAWEAIDDICAHEGVSINDLCTAIDQRRSTSSRTATVRAFIVTYFREAVAEAGGLTGGHVNTLIPDFSA